MNTLPHSLVRFESQLEVAISRQRSRRPRTLALRTALVGAVAGAVVLGIASALPGGGPSVVDRATAALAPGNGSILHVVLEGTTTSPDGAATSERIETWRAGSPPYDTREITSHGDRRYEVGTADGSAQLYDPATNTVYVSQIANKPDISKGAPAKPGATTTVPPERVADRYREKILGLLQSGRIHEDGHVSIDGRDGIRLVSDDGNVVLTVAAGTYEPIDWRVREGGRSAVARFPVYEQLPATDANAALTSVMAQHPDATVDTDPADYEAAAQRLEPKKVEPAKRGDTSKPEPKKTP